MSKSEVSVSRSLGVIDVYTAIDLDRTILKSTAMLYENIVPALKVVNGFDEETIELILTRERELRGQAFDFIAYGDKLASEHGLGPIVISELAEAIVDRQREASGQVKDDFVESILVNGTLQLMHELSSRAGERWGIMTSGGVRTQSLKYQIVSTIVREKLELSFPVQIISTEYKARTIVDEWYDRALELFILPDVVTGGRPLAARAVRLLDDKQQNLETGPDISPRMKGRIDLHLVQTAESSVVDGSTIQDILQKIQQPKG